MTRTVRCPLCHSEVEVQESVLDELLGSCDVKDCMKDADVTVVFENVDTHRNYCIRHAREVKDDLCKQEEN